MTPRNAEAAGFGLLAVHAHPDDETLATGGLLAAWAASGRPVTVVTCTRGELGDVIVPELAHLEGDGRALAAHRETELAGALAALGVTGHVFLDTVLRADGGTGRQRFSDSGMTWAEVGRAGRGASLPTGAFVDVPLDLAAALLARVLRLDRPAVVVTCEPGGGYGHPDHVRAHQVTMRALELAGDPEHDRAGLPAYVPRAVLWAVVADDVLRRAYRDLPDLPVAAALLRADPGIDRPDPAGLLPSIAVPPADVDLAVDITGVVDRVAAALGAHATQMYAIAIDRSAVRRLSIAAEPVADGPVVVGCYALSNDLLAPILSEEYYRFAPGSPRGEVDWPAVVRPVR